MATIVLGGENREIEGLSYSEIVALVQERNRPSGGIKTVHEVAVNTFLNKEKTMLEIGSNTGFTSVNISLLTGCKTHGIDAIQESVTEAGKYAQAHGVAESVKFSLGNALSLDFASNSFDAVWSSNVTSFINDKEKAISEYLRILKINGFLIVVPIYYHETPPPDILSDVSKAIGADLQVWGKEYWVELFSNTAKVNGAFLEKVYESDYAYLDRTTEISSYIDTVLSKEHLKFLEKDQFEALKTKFHYFIELFNENLKYARYSVLIYQKRELMDETELFLSKRV